MLEASRMKGLPLYLFTIMDDLKAKAQARGTDVIELGMGNPDLPSPPNVVEALCRAARNLENQRYSRPDGPVEMRLKEAIAQWYQSRFGVTLNPKTEVLPLIGSKEGIAHLSLTFLNPDDVGLVPTPAYPPHGNGVVMAGGKLVDFPMKPENGFQLDLEALPKAVVAKTKILFVTYPHNPTGAVAQPAFYQKLVEWGRGKETILCSDLAYSDIVFDGYRAPSLMQVKGAKDQVYGIEFHTASKSYNMAGWRIAWVVGNAEVLRSLSRIKSYIDFGIFRAVQEAAIEALTGPQDFVLELVETYRRRRDLFVKGLNDMGWKTELPKATFYIWVQIPEAFRHLTSLKFAELLVDKAGVVVAPGSGFGEAGEGFIRFALVEPEERLQIALDRLKTVLKSA